MKVAESKQNGFDFCLLLINVFLGEESKGSLHIRFESFWWLIRQLDTFFKETDWNLLRWIRCEEKTETGVRSFESKEIKNSLEALEETLESIEELAESLNGSTRPMIMHMDSAAVALNATLQATQGILENVEAMTSPESAFRYETQTAMKEMSEMARSLRFLADELERNPGSLLRGKSEEQQ